MSTTIVESVSRTSSDDGPALTSPYVHESLRHTSSKALETPVTERALFSTEILSVPEDVLVGRREKTRYRLVLASAFFCFFTLGMNDGSTGPLLPVYQSFYHVRDPST